MLGLVRVVHPFPSILDGLATVAIAIVAGGPPSVVLRLGLAMTAMQFAIGALNDLVDAPRDLGRKPGKPLPAGAVGRGTVRTVVMACLAVGLGLSALSGPLVLAVATAGVATGFAYDLRLKGTPWAWMAYAVGVPLLPVYAWLGAVGTLPFAFLVLVPLAAIAGVAVAMANMLVDVDRDRAARTLTLAVALGPTRAWRFLAGLQVLLGTGALTSLVLLGGGGPGILVTVAAVALVWLGVALERSPNASTRERGWELQAVGIATLAAGWGLALVDGGG